MIESEQQQQQKKETEKNEINKMKWEFGEKQTLTTCRK